jgi:hypothetical protein
VVRQPVVVWAIALVTAWSFVYGFLSVYNLGAAARFKLQILPVALLLAAYFATGGKVPIGRTIAAHGSPSNRNDGESMTGGGG